jgi:hypothetical protein
MKKAMNFYSATIHRFRRLAARRRAPRTVEKRTYVFILVPFDFQGNGHAQKAEAAQLLIENITRVDRARPETPPVIPAVDRVGSDVPDELQLNYDLMWTWFLPNPLWPPKREE